MVVLSGVNQEKKTLLENVTNKVQYIFKLGALGAPSCKAKQLELKITTKATSQIHRTAR